MASALLHAVICSFSAISSTHWLIISLRDITCIGGAFNLTGSCSEGRKIGGWLEPRVILDSRHYRNVYYKGFLKQYLVEAKLRQKSPMKKGIVSFYPEHSWIDLWSSVINYLPTIISVFIRQEVPRWPWKCCLFQQVRPGAQYIKVSQVL